MECIIQVFPDDYHIVTLDKFLSACLELQNEVDFKTILTSLMDRLANYAKQFPENIPKGVDIIETFTEYIAKIAEVCTLRTIIDGSDDLRLIDLLF